MKTESPCDPKMDLLRVCKLGTSGCSVDHRTAQPTLEDALRDELYYSCDIDPTSGLSDKVCRIVRDREKQIRADAVAGFVRRLSERYKRDNLGFVVNHITPEDFLAVAAEMKGEKP